MHQISGWLAEVLQLLCNQQLDEAEARLAAEYEWIKRPGVRDEDQKFEELVEGLSKAAKENGLDRLTSPREALIACLTWAMIRAAQNDGVGAEHYIRQALYYLPGFLVSVDTAPASASRLALADDTLENFSRSMICFVNAKYYIEKREFLEATWWLQQVDSQGMGDPVAKLCQAFRAEIETQK